MLSALSKLIPIETSMLGVAAKYRIPIIWLDRLAESELDELRAVRADVLLVAGFSIILKRKVLDVPRIGCVNCHSSLLPRHRGPNPFAAAILSGDSEAGVTFHIMDEGIDTGDILAQYRFPLGPSDTAADVYRKACDLASKNVTALMDEIAEEGLHGQKQDESAASYDERLMESNSIIDWTRPAEELDRLVRACRPFPVAHFRHQGDDIKVLRTKVIPTSPKGAPGIIVGMDAGIHVATGKGTLTVLSAYCKKPIPWRWPAPWNRPKVGDRLE